MSHGNGKCEVRKVLLERSREPGACVPMKHGRKQRCLRRLRSGAAWEKGGERWKEKGDAQGPGLAGVGWWQKQTFQLGILSLVGVSVYLLVIWDGKQVEINSVGNQSSLMGQWDSKGWQEQRAVDNAVQGFPKKKVTLERKARLEAAGVNEI